MKRRWSAVSLVLALGCAGCASPPPERPAAHAAGVTVSGAWRRGTVSSQPATALNLNFTTWKTSESTPRNGGVPSGTPLTPLGEIPNVAAGSCSAANAMCGSSTTAWMFGIREQGYDSATSTYPSGSLADGTDHPAVRFFTTSLTSAAITEGRYKLSLDTRCRVVDYTNTSNISAMPRCDDAATGAAIAGAALTLGLYCTGDTSRTFVERFTVPMSEDRRRVEYEFVMPTTCTQGVAVAFELRHGIEADVGLPDAVIGSTTSVPPPSFTGPWQFPATASTRYLTYLVDAVTIQPLFTSNESSVHYREAALGLADYWRMFGMNGHGATLDSAGQPVPATLTLTRGQPSTAQYTTTLRLADATAYGAASNGVPGAILERTQTVAATVDGALTQTSQSALYLEVDHIARATPPTVNGVVCFAPLRPDEVMPWSAPTSDEISAAGSLTVPRFTTPDRRPRVAFAVYNPGATAAPVSFSLPGNRTVPEAPTNLYAVVYGPMPVSVQNEDTNPWVASYRIAPSFLHKCAAGYDPNTARTTYTCNEWNIPAAGSRLFVLEFASGSAAALSLTSPARGCVNVTNVSQSYEDPSRRVLLTTVNEISKAGADALSMSATAAREYGLSDYAISTSVSPTCGSRSCVSQNCDENLDGQIDCAPDYHVAVGNEGAQFTGMRPAYVLTGATAQHPNAKVTTPNATFACAGAPAAPTVTAYSTTYRVYTDDAETFHSNLLGVLDVTRPSEACSCDSFALRPGDTFIAYKYLSDDKDLVSLGTGHVVQRFVSPDDPLRCRLVLDVPLNYSSGDVNSLRLRRVNYGDNVNAVSNLNRVIENVQAGAPTGLVNGQAVPLYPNGADSCPTQDHILNYELGVSPCAAGDAECQDRTRNAATTLWPIGCPRPISRTLNVSVANSVASVDMQCWERRGATWQRSLDCHLWAPFNAAQRSYYLGYATAFAAFAEQAGSDLIARMPLDMDEDKRLGVNRAPTSNGNSTNRLFFPGFGMTEAYDMARQVELADQNNANVQIAMFNTSGTRFVLGEARVIAEQFDPQDGPQGYGGIAWVDYVDMAHGLPMLRMMTDTLTSSAGATMFTPRRTVRSGGYERAPAFALGERYAVGLHRLTSEFGNVPMNAYLWNFYPLNATFDPIYTDISTAGITGAAYLRHRDRLGWEHENPGTIVARSSAVILPRGVGAEYDESWVGASIYAGFEDYRLGRARRARVNAWRLPTAMTFGARDSRHSSTENTQLSSVVRRDEHSQCMIERALRTDYHAVRTGSETPSQTLSRLCRDYY